VDALLPENLGALTRKAAALREVAAAQVPTGTARRSFWQDFFFGSVAEASKTGDQVAYELALGDSLFNHSQGAKGRLSIIVPPADVELLTLKAQRRLMEADVIVTLSPAPALLEMARRDAVRSSEMAEGLALAARGRNAVIICDKPSAIQSHAPENGVLVEVLDHGLKTLAHPFPMREDLRDAILRAAL